MTLDLTTWRARREDADDPDSYVLLEWVGLDAFWDTAPIDEIADLTWGEFEGYYARARAITAVAYALILNLNTEDRPYVSQVSVELQDQGGPCLSAQIPLKVFRERVALAVELIDSRKDDFDAPIVEDVIESREITRQQSEIQRRVHQLTSQDEELRRWVWANIAPRGHAQRMDFLDRLEAELITAKANAAMGAPADDGPLLTEAASA